MIVVFASAALLAIDSFGTGSNLTPQFLQDRPFECLLPNCSHMNIDNTNCILCLLSAVLHYVEIIDFAQTCKVHAERGPGRLRHRIRLPSSRYGLLLREVA